MLIDELKKREIHIFEAFAIGRIIYARVIKTILPVVLVLGIPISVLLFFLTQAMNDLLQGIDLMSMVEDIRILEQFLASANGKQFYFYVLLNIAVYVIFLPLITVCVTQIAYSFLKEEPISVKEVLARVLSKSHVIIPAMLIRSFSVMAVMMLLMLIGLGSLIMVAQIVYVYMMFCECSIIAEDKGAIASIKNSGYMVKGNALMVILFGMLSYGLENSVTQLVSVVFSVFPEGLMTMVAMNITSMLLTTYFTVNVVVYYVSRKAAKEREVANMQNMNMM